MTIKIPTRFSKKLIATVLTASVLMTGSFTAFSSAMAGENQFAVESSKDGQSIKVIKNGKLAIDVEKKGKFEAVISRTTSKGETETITMKVVPIKDNDYKVIMSGQDGKKVESIETINPLDEKMVGSSGSLVDSPNVIIKTIMDHKSPSWSDVAGTFGATAASMVVGSWRTLVSLWNSGGYWAVFAMVMDWEIVGAALVAGLVY